VGKADRLSRRPDWKVEVKKKNNEKIGHSRFEHEYIENWMDRAHGP